MGNKIAGIISLLLSGVLTVFHSRALEFIIHFITVHLSPDNYIKTGSIAVIRIYYFIQIIILILLGLFFLLNMPGRIRDLVTRLVETEKVKDFFLADELLPGKSIPLIIFITGSVSGFTLLMYYLLCGRPAVEGILENITTGFLCVSAVLLIISAFRIRRIYSGTGLPGSVFLSLMFFSFLLLILAGEEVSWGFHFLGYESDHVFKEINFQGETNVHNLFNPFFHLVYPVAGFMVFIIYWLLWTFGKGRGSFLFHLLMPPRSLYILIFLMACSGCAHTTEIFEEMLYTLILLYSIRLLLCQGPRTIVQPGLPEQ